MKKTSFTLYSLFTYLIIAFLWSCEELEMVTMKLTNNTNQTMSFLAMTVERSHRIDLKLKGRITNETRIIAPGGTATLYKEDIWSYTPEDDIRIFFSEVIGDSIFMSGGLDLTHSQLKKLRFHVVIDDEEQTTSSIN